MKLTCSLSHPLNRSGFRRGHTLIELLVVVAIIAVIASLLLPAVTRALQHGKEKWRRIVEIEQTKLELFSQAPADDPRLRAHRAFMEERWLGYDRYQEPWTNALIQGGQP